MAELAEKKIVIIVGQKNYNDEEFNYILEALENQDAAVYTASNTLEKALGRMQGYIAPDFKIQDINVAEFDACIIIGGYGTRVYLWDDSDLHKVLNDFAKSGKLIAAINNAPVVLANAGILEGKKATVYPDYDSTFLLAEHNVKYVPENIIIDDDIITTNHSRFVDKFTDAIINKLKG